VLSQLTLMSPVAAKKLVSVWNPKTHNLNQSIIFIIANFGLCSGVFFKKFKFIYLNLNFFGKVFWWFLKSGELFPKFWNFFSSLYTQKSNFQFFWSLQCKKNLPKKIKAGCNNKGQRP
jgi:hypothetical protein